MNYCVHRAGCNQKLFAHKYVDLFWTKFLNKEMQLSSKEGGGKSGGTNWGPTHQWMCYCKTYPDSCLYSVFLGGGVGGGGNHLRNFSGMIPATGSEILQYYYVKSSIFYVSCVVFFLLVHLHKPLTFLQRSALVLAPSVCAGPADSWNSVVSPKRQGRWFWRGCWQMGSNA